MAQTKTFLSIAVAFLGVYYYKTSVEKLPESPIVTTRSGSLQGVISRSRDGREFFKYLGIPYAQPPIGPLRFASPQPPGSWNGVRDASSYGSVCIQTDLHSHSIIGEEDCLFLNIFLPATVKKDKLLPTMVWIHGGMFVLGSSNLYEPEYFMDHDIILVTINYRLGSFGFLTTGDEIVPGNMGLKDQSMALKWIQANIAHFGGDPKQVTIFGESAGSLSVHHHMFSPLSKGLFHRAISQSGVVVVKWGTRLNGIEQSKRFSALLSCPTQESKAMVECLRATDASKIMDLHFRELSSHYRDPISIFSPGLEKFQDGESFITGLPVDLLKEGKFNKVPWMVGVTDNEGLLITAPIKREREFKKVLDNFDVDLPNLLWHTGPADPAGLKKIKDFYLGKENMDSEEKFQNWTNIFTDAGFGAPTELGIRMQSQHAPVYAYHYSYKGQFSLTDLLLAISKKYPVILEYLYYRVHKLLEEKLFGIPSHHYGACHFDEVALQFPIRGFFIKPGQPDYEMSKAMTQTWVSFASEPELKMLKFSEVNWPPVDSKTRHTKYMHINRKPELIDEPNPERHTFWNTLKL